MNKYWKEAVEIAVDELGIDLSDYTLSKLAGYMRDAAEMESEACGYQNIPNPLEKENKELLSELMIERSKRVCEFCNGRGLITSYGPDHTSTAQCDRCSGEGKRVR